MCYGCDSTEHLANDLAFPKMAPRSRAAMQQRAETLDDALIRELLELRAKRAHLHKISSRAQVQEQCDGGGEEPGVVTSAAKVHRCSKDKLATTYACIAASSLTSHPSLAHFLSGAVKMRAERTHLRNRRLGCYLMVNVQCGSSLRDLQHGGLNEFFHTGRTRHFFLQVCCGVRVAHGKVILRACDLVNCRLTVCLYRLSPCRQTSWKTCANRCRCFPYTDLVRRPTIRHHHQ